MVLFLSFFFFFNVTTVSKLTSGGSMVFMLGSRKKAGNRPYPSA